MKSNQVISVAVAPVHKEASFSSEMITQGLMWESVTILRIKDNWCQIAMEDEYKGWIHDYYLTENNIHSLKSVTLTNRYTPIHSKKDENDSILGVLSFATVIPLLEKSSGYYTIQLINGAKGYIPSQYEVGLELRKELILLATSLLGVPYLWGGKSSFGYDCSGFVQMVLKSLGISVPRDTSQQVDCENLEKISMDATEPGDLVLFSENNRINHVAFIVGEGKILHCSGEVKLESIIEGETGFNSCLSQLDHTFLSISRMVSK